MAKNLANLGISWYSEDKEVQKDIGVLHESLDGIAETLGNIKKINAFKAVVDAVNLRALKDTAAGVSNSIKEVLGGQVDAAAAVGPLDSYYTNAAKSAAKLAANSSTVAENMELVNKSAGIARSLNMDADTIQKMAAEFEKLGVNAEKYGFKSFQQFVKMTEVAGVEGQDLIRTLRGLETGFGYSGEQAGELLDRVTYISREFGMGTQGVQKFGEVTGKLNEQLRMMGKDAGPEEFGKITESIYMLGGSMVSLGKEPSEAMSAAQDVFVKLAESQKEMKKLFIGEGNIPDLIQQGAIALGDFGSAQEMMQKAPMEFVQQLGKNYGSLSEQQKMFLDQNVLSEFDADVDWMVKGNWKKVEKTLGNVKSNLDDASGAAGNMAEHYRSGYTWGERLNMVTEDYEQKLASISQGALGDVFVERQRKFYLKTLAPFFEKLSKGNFMIGETTEYMNKGLSKLAPNLQASSKTVSDIQQTLSKVYAGYRAAGFEGAMVSLLEAPPAMKLLAKYTGATFEEIRKANESGYLKSFELIADAARPMWQDIKNSIKDIWDDIKSAHPWLKGMERIFHKVAEKAREISDRVKKFLTAIGKGGFEDTAKKAKNSVSLLGESEFGMDVLKKTVGIGGLAAAMPGGNALLGAIGFGSVLRAVEEEYKGGITKFMKDVTNKFYPLIEPHIKGVIDAFTKFFKAAMELINWQEVGEVVADSARMIIKSLGTGLSIAVGGANKSDIEKAAKNGDMQAKMSLMMGTVMEGVWEAVKETTKGFFSSMWESVFGAPDEDKGLMDTVGDAGKTVAGMFVAGVLVGIGAFFTRSKILKAIGAVLRAPIAIPIKFVTGTTKAATKGYLTAKAISKVGDVASKAGMAGDVGKLEARLAGASGKEAKALKGSLRRAKMGAKLRGAGTKIAGGAAKAVEKTGFMGRVLGIEAAADKAKLLGNSLKAAGGAAPEAMKSMTFMKSLKGVLAESKLVKFFKLFAKAGKGVVKVVRPIFKIVQKIVGPVIMIYEYFKRLPDIISNFSSIFTEALDPDELTKKGFEIAKGFASILDAWFLNIPSWIGEKLGVTSELVEGFYQFLVLQTSLAIDEVVTFFSTMGDRIDATYYGIKATALETFVATGLNALQMVDTMVGGIFDFYEGAADIFFDISKIAAERFVDMQNKGSIFVNEMKRMFAVMYNVIVHDVFQPLIQKFTDIVGGLFKKLMSNPLAKKALEKMGYGKKEDFDEIANFNELIFGEDYDKEKAKENTYKRFGVSNAAEMAMLMQQRRQAAGTNVEAARAQVKSGLGETEGAIRGGIAAGGAGLKGVQNMADASREQQEKATKALEKEQRANARRDRRAEQRAQRQTGRTLKGPGSATPAGREGVGASGDKKQDEKLGQVANASQQTASETKKLREVAERLEKNFNRPFPKRTTGDEAP